MIKAISENKVYTIVEKRVHGKTTGYTSVSTYNGETVSSQSTRTDKVQTVMFEDEDGKTFTKEFVNHEIEVPDGRKIAMNSINGVPVAYIGSKNDECKPLNSLAKNYKSDASYIKTFLFMMFPVINLWLILCNLTTKRKYYDKVTQSFTLTKSERFAGTITFFVAIISSILVAIVYASYHPFPYINFFYITYIEIEYLGIIPLILTAWFYTSKMMGIENKIYEGNIELFKRVSAELEPLRNQL